MSFITPMETNLYNIQFNKDIKIFDYSADSIEDFYLFLLNYKIINDKFDVIDDSINVFIFHDIFKLSKNYILFLKHLKNTYFIFPNTYQEIETIIKKYGIKIIDKKFCSYYLFIDKWWIIHPLFQENNMEIEDSLFRYIVTKIDFRNNFNLLTLRNNDNTFWNNLIRFLEKYAVSETEDCLKLIQKVVKIIHKKLIIGFCPMIHDEINPYNKFCNSSFSYSASPIIRQHNEKFILLRDNIIFLQT